MATTEATTKVKTGKVRISYAHLLSPRPDKNGKLKFGCSIIIPKSDTATLKAIKAAIEVATEKGQEKFGKKKFGDLDDIKTPLRDGDKDKAHRDDPAYKNSYFLNCSSDSKPGIVDKELEFLTTSEEVYSGMYARVTLNLFPYSADGSNGVGAGLNNMQKIKDGDRFDGRASAESDFEDDFEDEDADLL